MSKLESKESQKNSILNDNLWGLMFKLSWPAIIAMLLYGLNTVFDAIFVGKFVGETELAGVSLVYPLTQIVTGIGFLIGVGSGSALSIAIGGNNKETQNKVLENMNCLTILSCVVYMILAWVLAVPLVRMMGGFGDTLAVGVNYFRITIIGSFFWIYGLSTNMIIRAEGKMKLAAIIMGSGLIVNIIMNYIFLVKLGLGVVGAAWGTNIGMLLYSVLGMAYFLRGNVTFSARPLHIALNQDVLKQIISMGFPSFIMSAMNVIQGIVVLNAIARYGTTYDLAFYGAVLRIFTLLLTPLFGLMRALQPVIGMNYGSCNSKRVINSFKVFSLAGMLMMLPLWALIMISPKLVLGLIFNIESITYSSTIWFRVYMLLLPIMPVLYMAMTFFPAINKGKTASLVGIARQLILYIPVMLILPRIFGVRSVYYGGFGIDLLISCLVIVLVVKEFKILKGGCLD